MRMIAESLASAELLDDDFDVFVVPGLEPRMTVLRNQLRPKLERFGHVLAPVLSDELGFPMHAHVARHARRKTNPPSDSWVAFSHDPRGYKKWPAYMAGVWHTHLYVQAGVIYESSYKAAWGRRLEQLGCSHLRELLPDQARVYGDYTKPGGELLQEMEDARLSELLTRVQTVKQADLLFGYELSRELAVSLDERGLLAWLTATALRLAPLYTLAMTSKE